MVWEIIGYCGSALVLVSLLMSSVIKLRIINTIGCLIFCIYAFKINSIPTALMNLALVGIDLFFLIRMLTSKKVFTCMEVTAEDSAVRCLNREDMARYFGEVDLKGADVLLAVYDGTTVAGLTAGIARGNSLELLVDYSTPQYRDCSVGKYVCEELATRFSSVVYTGSNEQHIAYVRKLGYEKHGSVYEKTLRKENN